MSRLRDAILVIEPGDLANIQRVLKRRFIRRRKGKANVDDAKLEELAEQYVRERYRTEYRYFAHRCRRSIPAPEPLEAALRDVVALFANSIDASTAKQLFTQKTWVVFRSLIVHVRKACLSDHPDLCYYYTTHTTKDGRVVYHHNRGTSQLEGYHRHMRELIAQASHSPRLAAALLRCCNFRWNHNRSVENGDRERLYYGWFDLWLVEEIQETTALLYDEPSHSSWISTRDFESTGERFYVPGGTDDLIDEAFDNDVAPESREAELWRATLPPALRWLARTDGHKIPPAGVSTPQEVELFNKNWRSFMLRSTSANAHEAIDYSAFAEWWESQVREKEAREDFGSGIFRKSASLLRKYAKKRLRQLNTASTIAGVAPNNPDTSVRDANKELCRQLRDPTRVEEFCAPSGPLPLQRRAEAPQPSECTATVPPTATRAPVAGPVFVPQLQVTRAQLAPVLVSRPPAALPQPQPPLMPDRESANTKTNPRCRRCGHLKADTVGRGKHANRVHKTSAAFCRVDPASYLPGYPKRGYEIS